VAVNGQNAIRSVNGEGEINTVASGDPLDFPADVAFNADGHLFIANFAIQSESPSPALLRTQP
jgi:hypothetical protein